MERATLPSADLLAALPARSGHFLLESGYHTNVWLALDALFIDEAAVAPLVAALAERIRAHAPSAVCGPLMGGAFLAHSLAVRLGAPFFYSEPCPPSADRGLFQARYSLAPELRRRLRGHRVAVVDDAISAGSSVRATIAAVEDAGAIVAAVGTLLLLGQTGLEHLGARGLPVEALARRPLSTWTPGDCPLCREGHPLENTQGPETPCS